MLVRVVTMLHLVLENRRTHVIGFLFEKVTQMVPMVYGNLHAWSLIYFFNSEGPYCLFLLRIWSLSYLKKLFCP